METAEKTKIDFRALSDKYGMGSVMETSNIINIIDKLNGDIMENSSIIYGYKYKEKRAERSAEMIMRDIEHKSESISEATYQIDTLLNILREKMLKYDELEEIFFEIGEMQGQ